MKEIISSIISTPIPIIFIIFGIILLLIAIGVQITTKVVTTNVKPKTAGILGGLFLIFGLVLNILPSLLVLDKKISRNTIAPTSNKKIDDITYKEENYPTGEKHFKYKYVKNELNGETIEFSKGGEILFKYTYKKGQLSGVTKQYGKYSNVDWFYENGILVSGIEYYSTGEIKIKFNFKNGKREGISSEFFKSGKRKYEWLYSNNKLNGKTKEFNSNGDLINERDYKDGTLVK